MTVRGFSRLPVILRKSHRLTKSWRATSSACKVLTEDGRENPGLAKRIAIDGYIPSDEVIERLQKDGAMPQRIKRFHRDTRPLFDRPVEVLLWQFNHREVMV